MNKTVEWIVLTKAPIPGLVKTRLIPALGEQAACELYEQLLVRMQNTLKQVIRQSNSQVAVWVAGDAEHESFNSWKPFADFYQQPIEGDLGVRMALAVQSALSRDCIPVLIGVDVPDLDKGYLLDCLKQLEHSDVVISPAEDGGYGLLGMKQFHSELFQHKAWGTETVFRDTEADLTALTSQQKLKISVLPQVWDVDELPDVERFRLIQSE